MIRNCETRISPKRPKAPKAFKRLRNIRFKKNTDTNSSVHFPKTEYGVCLSCFHIFKTNRTYHTRFYATGANSAMPSKTLASGIHTQCSNTQTSRRRSFFRRRKVTVAHPFFTFPFSPTATHALKYLRRLLRRETFCPLSPPTLRLVSAHNRAPPMPPPHRRTRRLFSAHRP